MKPEEEDDLRAFVESKAEELAERKALDRLDYPEAPRKDTQLDFMRDVVAEDDPLRQSKTANFTKEEVGKAKLPVLSLLSVSRYADSEGYNLVAEFLRQEAFDIAAVSLGRKAKLIDTLFTVRRESRTLQSPSETVNKTMFGTTIKREGFES